MSEYLNIGLDITGLLDNSPTYGKGPALIMCRGIEYMPVRHGRWIKISPAGIYECSECGQNVMTKDIDVYKRCHNCGARMDGEEE